MGDDKFYVLVVDDVADSADSAVELLSCWGYEAAACYGGAAALDSARDRMPDAVLLDVGMPRVDGFAFAARFRQLPGSAAALVVAVTGHTAEACRARGRVVGIDHYLLKPADPGLLRGLLAGLAGRLEVLPARVGASGPRSCHASGDSLTPGPVSLSRPGALPGPPRRPRPPQ